MHEVLGETAGARVWGLWGRIGGSDFAPRQPLQCSETWLAWPLRSCRDTLFVVYLLGRRHQALISLLP